MSKKIKIPGNKKRDLEGFEELLDEIINEGDLAYKSKLQENKQFDNYKLFNFLELEKSRALKLKEMVTKKIPNVIEYNQSAEVMERLTYHNIEVKESIVKEIRHFDSVFHKNIRELFNNAFKN